MTNTCEHGHLARSFEMCDRDKRIKELEAEVERLRSVCRVAAEQLRHYLRNQYWMSYDVYRKVSNQVKNLANEGSNGNG